MSANNIILSIAGSDSSGGAGIQADVSTITKLGGVAMTAITAVTSQDCEGVYDVHYIPCMQIASQIEVTMKKANAIKTGMLCNSDVIKVVSDLLPDDLPVIVDPVIVSTSGCTLLELDAVDLMIDMLFKKALLLTPNIPEAEFLTGDKIRDHQGMVLAAKKILSYGPKGVLVKGGHLIEGNEITDILVTYDQVKYQ